MKIPVDAAEASNAIAAVVTVYSNALGASHAMIAGLEQRNRELDQALAAEREKNAKHLKDNGG